MRAIPLCLALAACAAAGETAFVLNGQPKLVRQDGRPWASRDGTLQCGGTGNFLFAGKALGPGDFHVSARLTIRNLARSAASFTFDGTSHFGFEGGHGRMFVEGPLFGRRSRAIGQSTPLVEEGKPFLFEAVRKGDTVAFRIDGKDVLTTKMGAGPLGAFGFRPWRSTMHVHSFAAEGNLTDLPKPLEGQVDVFTSGTDGYHTFRIPAIIASPKGHLLAFCEGRKKSGGDTGDIDIVMKRSTDAGATWSAMQVIADHGPHVIGNPCPVVDQSTGTIWMLLTRNRGDEPEGHIMKGTTKEPRTVWVMKSTDDGQTWTEPVNISETTRKPHWRWYATGPGVGIQLRSGRMVIPCDHSDHDSGGHPYRSHVIYSDDHGATWKLGGTLADRLNECQVVELADGRLMLNMRSYHGQHRRHIALSSDRGDTWTPSKPDDALIEPVCQASILRYTLEADGGRNRLLFSNPASTGRVKMTVRLSYDEGATWPVANCLHPGPSAYSCLVVLPDRTMGCLYERGRSHAYEHITFARFTLDWLTAGTDRLAK